MKHADNRVIVLAGTMEGIVGDQRYEFHETRSSVMRERSARATMNAGDDEVQAVKFYFAPRGEGPDMDPFPADLPSGIRYSAIVASVPCPTQVDAP